MRSRLSPTDNAHVLGLLVLALVTACGLLPWEAAAQELRPPRGAAEFSARIDSLVAIRDSLSMRVLQLGREIDALRAEAATWEVAERDSLTSIVATVPHPGAYIYQDADQRRQRSQLSTGTSVVISGVENGLLIISAGARIGYVDPAFFSGDERVQEFFRERSYEENIRKAEAHRIEQRQVAEKNRAVAYADSVEQARRNEAETKRLATERDNRRKRILARYGNDVGARINAGEIWIGMTADMARESLGRPDKVNRTVTAGGVSEQWVYEYADLLVYFDDGFLTAWQD